MSRTALIIEAPISAALAALREKFAVDARFGVPPHLTILFPFVPVDVLDEVVTEILARTFRGMSQFDFSLTSTGWFGQEVLWLAPESPTPFIELTSAVTRAFPAYPPYGGLHDASVPHATVGDSAGYEALQDAERAVGAELPLSGTASAVVLLVEGPHGWWREASRFPLS